MSTAQIRRRKRRSNKVIQYVVAAITAMAVTNALIELAAPLSKQRLKRSRIKYIATPEGDLCTQVVGEEPSALLLHDLLPGCSMADYEALMTDTSADGVIAVDPKQGEKGIQHHLSRLNVTSIMADSKGRVWCGLMSFARL